MATTVSTILTDNPVTTVAALDAAIATIVAATDRFIGPPASTGDQIIQSGTALALPNAYTGVRWIAIPNVDLRLNPGNVNAIIGTLVLGESIWAAIQTRFGYCLFMVGQAAGTVMQSLSSAQDANADSAGSTITNPELIGTLGTMTSANLLNQYPFTDGWKLAFVQYVISITQNPVGFDASQFISVQASVYGTGSTVPNTSNACDLVAFPLPSGRKSIVLATGMIPIAIEGSNSVNATIRITSTVSPPGGSPLSGAITVRGAIVGVR